MIDPNDPATGALMRAVSGQYSIEREIGRGGMGVVYLAKDEQLERPVAIKTLPPHLAADPRVRVRFLREARTAGKLSHPNIVPIYTAAERDAVVYFAMRYINGESLADRISQHGSLPPAEVVAVLRQLSSALAYAHASGVVHRDIKAENVLLDNETGRAMLTDFGIARVTEELKPLTATGTVLGTVQYMSPEQVSGDTLDGRSDLYSLGILAFFALCGRFPFERPTASAIVVAHVTSQPPKVCSLASGVPAALGDIVDRLLAKSPDDRFPDGQALRTALDALQMDNGVSLVRADDSAPMPVASRSLGAQMGIAENRGLATPAGAASPDVMSSDDAQQIWARAAELQANTGLIVPPAEFNLRKPGAPLETAGYDAAIVRASAVDAGIDERYVDRALAERARLANSVARTDDKPITISVVGAAPKSNRFLNVRTKFELETAFDGELSDEGFEEIADEIRRGLGEMVSVSAVGRTLTVTATAVSGSGRHSTSRRMQIHLSSRNGRTTVRAFEDLSQTATAMFVGITIGGGFSGGSLVMGALMSATGNAGLAVVGLMSTMTVAFTLAHTLFKRKVRIREKELYEIMERIARRGKELVAENPRRLPPR